MKLFLTIFLLLSPLAVSYNKYHNDYTVLKKQYPKLTINIYRLVVKECAIQNKSFKYKLRPRMVIALMWGESRFTRRAVSRAGAKGLMQVMPYHFKKGENPFDPKTNIREGVEYLIEAWQRAHRWVGANSKTDYSTQHIRRYR